MTACPHGDPTCPCQDGDPCHYEGFDPMPCPNRPTPRVPTMDVGGTIVDTLTLGHCHVEGCTWNVDGCGLSRLGLVAVLPSDDVDLATPGSVWPLP